jgi:hypothetical protein
VQVADEHAIKKVNDELNVSQPDPFRQELKNSITL